MVPETALLRLHDHEHTQDKDQDITTLEKAHQHCHVDNLYNHSFQAAQVCISFLEAATYQAYIAEYGFAWKFTFPNNTFLRGPPRV